MRHITLLSLTLALSLGLSGRPALAISLGNFNNPFAPSPVVGRMGSTELTAKQVNEWLRHQPADVRQNLLTNPEALKEWIRVELLKRTLLNEAKGASWEKRPEVALAMERARDQAMIDAFVASRAEPEATFPTAKEIEAAYQANISQFMIPEQVNLAQILIRVSESASVEDNNRASGMVREIMARLKDGVDFGVLAGTYSQDETSKGKRGEIGWVLETDFTPQIREEVKTIKTGWIGKPLRSPFGWQILKVLDRRPATPRPLPEVKDAIVKALRSMRTNDNRSNYLSTVQKNNPSSVDDTALKAVTGQ